MTTGIPAEATENADRFYTMVKSLNNFDKLEVKGVIDTLLSTTPEENCFIGTYYRTSSNIESVLEFQHPKHFQAVAMLARGLFELAVDMRLLEVIPNGTLKMNEFIDVEKLRCAREIVAFKDANPNADFDTTEYVAFVTRNGERVDRIRQGVWPNIKRLYHWSGLRMGGRVALLKAPFDQLYEVDYPRLSWYTHPGLTGIANLKPETFTYICSYAFKLAADSYSEVLQTLIRKFGLTKTIEKIEHKLHIARIFPFTNTPEEVDVLTRSIQ
jgi:hypothetical protein